MVKKGLIIAGILLAVAIALTVAGRSLEPSYLHDNLIFASGITLGGAIAETVIALNYRDQAKDKPGVIAQKSHIERKGDEWQR